MNTLENLSSFITSIDCKREFNSRGIAYKVLRLIRNGDVFSIEELFHNDDCDENFGIYNIHVLGFSLYVGKAYDRNFKSRTYKHGWSFVNLTTTAESSGRKLRNLMLKHDLKELIINVDVIPCDHMMYIVPSLEHKFIDDFCGILNKEFYNRGYYER